MRAKRGKTLISVFPQDFIVFAWLGWLSQVFMSVTKTIGRLELESTTKTELVGGRWENVRLLSLYDQVLNEGGSN